MDTEIGVALGFGVGALATLVVRWLLDRRQARGARRRAEEVLRGAEKEAENIRMAADLAARDETFRRREEVEGELEETRKELRQVEKRLDRKEENLERKADQLARREEELAETGERLRAEGAETRRRQEDADAVTSEYRLRLEGLAGLTADRARQTVMERAAEDAESEATSLLARRLDRAREEADVRARDILVTAIQRVAVDHCAEATVSTVRLPTDEMKGRVIGREGRNIRAFEKATGVDVIVDDTPGVVVVSAFDTIRREIARRAMERLVLDGRIHPGRIEDVVEEARVETEEAIRKAGEEAVAEVELHGLHPKIVELLGRLKYRTSYGQNVLRHVIECAHLAGLIASELGLEPRLAKRSALLHDIGKSLSHEVEGGHVDVAADLARRLGEPPEVVNAIAAHHEDVKPTSPYAVITQTVDAISAARPGARRESLERYVRRMEELEKVAASFPGVRNAYAIHAGREVRVIVDPRELTDQEALTVCREIATAVAERLTYPGEVKVTVLRETRSVEYAR